MIQTLLKLQFLKEISQSFQHTKVFVSLFFILSYCLLGGTQSKATSLVLSDDYSLALFSNLSKTSFEAIFEQKIESIDYQNKNYDFLLDEIKYSPLSKQEYLSYRFLSDRSKSWPSFFEKLSSKELIHPIRLGETISDTKLQLLRLPKMKIDLQKIDLILHAFGILDTCQSQDNISNMQKNLEESLNSIEYFFKPLNKNMDVVILGMPAPGIEERFIEHCFDQQNRKSIRSILKDKFSNSNTKQMLWETLNFSDQSASDRCPLLSPYSIAGSENEKRLSQFANRLSDYRQKLSSLVEEKNKNKTSQINWHFIDASKKIFWKEKDTIYNCFDLNPNSSHQFAEFLWQEIHSIQKSTASK